MFEKALPEIGDGSRNSVVIFRLRGKSDLGTTFREIIARYAVRLRAVDKRLMIVSAADRVIEQLSVTGVVDIIGSDSIYPASEWPGAALEQTHDDADVWVRSRAPG